MFFLSILIFLVYIYIFFFFNEKSFSVAYGLKKNENKRYVELTLSQQKKQQLKTDKYKTAIPECAPYAKKCACNMHVTTNYMHVMVNMHVTLLLHECYMQVVRVLEMVAHVPCMLYECWVTSMLVAHVTCM